MWLRKYPWVIFRRILGLRFPLGCALLWLSLPWSLAAQDSTPQLDLCRGPLFQAIYRRDIETIQRLIASGTSLNIRACIGNRTPLIEAIVMRLDQIPGKMILAGADPNLGSDAITPLSAAAGNCRRDLVVLLLERGAAVDRADSDGFTPLLHAAGECSDESVAVTLMKAGAPVNVRSKTGATPLISAALSRRHSLVRKLLDAGAQIPSDPEIAVFVRKIARGEYAPLPRPAPRVRDDCGSPLLRTIFNRRVGEAEIIIRAGQGLNFRGCETDTTPLIAAISEELPEIAEKLIRAGADPDLAAGDGTTPLMAATFGCVEDLVFLLLERGARVNSTSSIGDSALIHAAYACMDGRIVGRLLKMGADVNHQTKYGATPLTTAAFSGNEDAVRQLVAAGANLAARNNEGKTALEIARDRKIGRKPSHDLIYSFLVRLIDH